MKRIKEIDGLRTIAIVAVLYAHSIPTSESRRTGAALGWMGVDLFFAISGFLITGILIKLKSHPDGYFRTFYARRTLRIFPPYYLLLTIYLIGTLLSSVHTDARGWIVHYLYLSTWMKWKTVQEWTPAPVWVGIAFAPLWSLSVEENFYLIWAPVVRFVRMRTFTLILIAIMVIAPAVRFLVHRPGEMWEFFWFPARLDSLAYGALGAILVKRIPASWPKLAFFTLGPLFILFAAVTNLADRTNLLFSVFGYSLIGAVSASLVLVAYNGAGSNVVFFRIMRLPLVQEIGKTSYVIYLIHTLVRYLVLEGLRGFGVRGIAFDVLVTLGSPCVTFALAALSWKYFETPILIAKDRFYPSQAEPNTVATWAAR